MSRSKRESAFISWVSWILIGFPRLEEDVKRLTETIASRAS